jgi:hypothetical protein
VSKKQETEKSLLVFAVVETGCHYVELTGSSDPPISASRVADTKGSYPHTQEPENS